MSDYTIPVRPFGGPTCYLPGRLVADPETRATTSGRTFCKVRVACGGGKKRDGGEWPTVFINAVAWDEAVIARLERLGKGAQVHASGELRTRKYQNRDGVEVEAWEVVISALHDHGLRDRPDTQRQAPRAQAKQQAQDDFGGWDDDGSVPF